VQGPEFKPYAVKKKKYSYQWEGRGWKEVKGEGEGVVVNMFKVLHMHV
jgi:hypothetical protein